MISKIDEMAEKAAADRFPDICGTTSSERFDPYKESEIQSIKQVAFADGYKQAIADCYPVVKPKDLVEYRFYWIRLRGHEWDLAGCYCVGENWWFRCGYYERVLASNLAEIRGPILRPGELGIGKDGG